MTDKTSRSPHHRDRARLSNRSRRLLSSHVAGAWKAKTLSVSAYGDAPGAIVLFSGLGPIEQAQEELNVGIGALAGGCETGGASRGHLTPPARYPMANPSQTTHSLVVRAYPRAARGHIEQASPWAWVTQPVVMCGMPTCLRGCLLAAGSTIMLLTIPWGLSVLGGRVSLDSKGQPMYKYVSSSRTPLLPQSYSPW